MMYTVYTPNGQITKVVGCDNIQEQLAPNESYIEGDYPDNQYYIQSGAPVSMPPKPNQYCIFDYVTKQWVDPRTPETQWPLVRTERNRRLQACDWTQLSDIPAETKTLWEPYRQALRDITNQPDPFNIIWPTPPQ
jgi:hypothetical protein